MAQNDRFRASLAKQIEKSKGKFQLFYKKFTIDLQTAVIQKTPVDQGQLHWNWFIGNAAPSNAFAEHTGNDKSGAIARNTALINSLNINGQVIYISNSLPYAHRIEYEGWSKQAPAGMLRVSVSESQSIAKKIGIELRAI